MNYRRHGRTHIHQSDPNKRLGFQWFYQLVNRLLQVLHMRSDIDSNTLVLDQCHIMRDQGLTDLERHLPEDDPHLRNTLFQGTYKYTLW